MGQRMSLSTKRELVEGFREEYLKANTKQRRQILDGVVMATGYDRKHAIKRLRAKESIGIKKRLRSRQYDERVRTVLCLIWEAAGYICSKRFIPFLPDFLPVLERVGYLTLAPEVRNKLLTISTATASIIGSSPQALTTDKFERRFL